MASQTITADFTSQIVASGAGDVIVVAAGVTGTTATTTINAIQSANDRVFDIAGSLETTVVASCLLVGSPGHPEQSSGGSLTVRRTGSMTSDLGQAVFVTVEEFDIVNRGTIQGKVGIGGEILGGTIHNAGRIIATQECIDIDGSFVTITNDGVVSTTGETAIVLSGVGQQLVNTGTIRASGDGPPIRTIDTSDSFGTPIIDISGKLISGGVALLAQGELSLSINAGAVVKGDVVFDDGVSSFFLRGQLDGKVFGGTTTCTFDIGRQAIDLVDGGGNYSIRATVDTRLDDFVRGLQLDGGGDIKGVGNALANTISENRGDNLLKGLGGDDFFFCDKGDDTYILGGGADHVTYLSGRGHDTIVDFVPGEDAFDVFGRSASFVEIKASLFNVDGGVEYRDDGAVMFFKGLKKADLGADSFDFPS